MKGPPEVRKIAFVSTMDGLPWGGSEELWSQTAGRLRQEGLAVSASLYGWTPRPRRVAELGKAGVKLNFRPVRPRFPGRSLEKLRQRFFPTPVASASMRWLKRLRPDLLVISQGWAWDGIPWMNACRALGIPYCSIVQAHGEHWWPMDEELQAARPAMAGAAKLFFVSRANRDLMERQCGARLPNAAVVNNPWKVEASAPVAWPADTGTWEIACSGRLDPRAKGQDLLMQVMAMPKWRERPLKLNLYGDGPCEDSLKALAALLDLRNVEFRGHVGDVRSIWEKNHALVLPSRFEGLPLVIVEAMFCGRAVITTDIAGNAEYLTEGVTGFIAEAPAVSLLDKAMERAWARRADWREMGAAARREVVATLPADPVAAFADRLLELAR